MSSHRHQCGAGIPSALATNPNVLQNLPWVWVPPALAIALIVLAINFVGDGLRDAVDPRAVRRA